MRNLLPADRALNLVVWAVLLGALGVWHARSLVTQRTAGVADLVALARRGPLTRWAVLAGWAWVGWHLFVRTGY